ncbi:hypothetical protein B0H15DRAFT_833054 [Mycena belliarum]|uniref:Uncharacterized protein n=1 Tax=Mycena belliarum TaxID=1033014 RepID=A0AAD6XPA0_9AGAR|nr:hypothetical protein B0H15DRAFT_833054 [Mycena belliae]
MKHPSPLPSSAASISSFQSFDTVRQATRTPSTAPSSLACPDDHRWSEVVPPDSGLTFAVIWDPDAEDLLTFSSAALSAPDCTSDSPDSPSDAYSQVLTIGPSGAGASELDCAPTPAFYAHNNGFRFAESAYDFPDRRTQTSSTLDGLDVYLRGSLLGRAHTANPNRYASCFRTLDADKFAFDPRTSFANAWMRKLKRALRDDVSDEGFFEGGQYLDDDSEPNMCSAFSVSDTSTSNFITVSSEDSDASSSTWSALEAPKTPGYSRTPPFTGISPAHRRLRKPRPTTPAPPAAVLTRAEYSHNLPIPVPGSESPVSPRPPSRPSSPRVSLPKFARGLSGRWKKTETDGPGWVWVDVKGEP